jgi:hypothetical protein
MTVADLGRYSGCGTDRNSGGTLAFHIIAGPGSMPFRKDLMATGYRLFMRG